MNIVSLPVNNLNDIARMARQFADDLEAGKYAGTTTVVVAMECDEGLISFGWGDADDGFRVAGLFHAAAHTQLSEMVG